MLIVLFIGFLNYLTIITVYCAVHIHTDKIQDNKNIKTWMGYITLFKPMTIITKLLATIK